jgi:hypothetical protein
LLVGCCLLSACSRGRERGEANAQATRETLRARFAACLAVYAAGEAADFDLPQYLMSRGRWLINERARTYLLDEACREYRLKDRRLTVGEVPQGGRIKVGAGEAREFTLTFPRLPDGVHAGALVYGGWVLPFYVLPAAPAAQ